MNNPRANIAHIVMAAGGGVLALSSFLSWLEETSLWKAMSFFDIVITLGAIATTAIAVMHITGAAANQPALKAEWVGWVGLVPAVLAISLVLEFAFGPGEPKFGAWIGFLASLAIIAGVVLREKPELADRVNQATAGIGSGGGPGGPGGPGGFGQQQPPGGGFGQPGAGAGPGPASPGPAAAQPAPAAQPQQPATAPQPAASPQSPQSPGGGGGAPAGATQVESSGPAPGWYPDPQGQKRLRYWDGSRWTEQTAD